MAFHIEGDLLTTDSQGKQTITPITEDVPSFVEILVALASLPAVSTLPVACQPNAREFIRWAQTHTVRPPEDTQRRYYVRVLLQMGSLVNPWEDQDMTNVMPDPATRHDTTDNIPYTNDPDGEHIFGTPRQQRRDIRVVLPGTIGVSCTLFPIDEANDGFTIPYNHPTVRPDGPGLRVVYERKEGGRVRGKLTVIPPKWD